MHPFIGVTGNAMSINRPGDVQSFYINYSARHFTKMVEDVGGIPFIIPITSETQTRDFVSRLDGLLLAGGQDVSPFYYGEEPRKVMGPTSPERDAFEIALIEEAIKQQKPILAVCRGMQLVNVVLAGSLLQDVEEDPTITVQHVQQSLTHYATHSINLNPDSRLYKIAGEPSTRKIKVNSFHHQVIKDLGKELSVSSRSLDDVIESVESNTDKHDIIGVQWHPELLTHNPAGGREIFADLICRASSNK